ncbi:MAG TPA: SWIM zinc finger family protein, partial [Oceanipulchritudo sp.]|nr:SWIM zinc finger family protein [Oceanipulchritudo sp.]
MGFLSFPEFTREGLAELGGWSLLREGRTLFRAGAVNAVGWERPLLTGSVLDKGVTYEPVLDLRSLTFVRNTCTCPTGRRGQVCAHALALCLQAQREV